MKLLIEIDLGNAAMQTPTDVAFAVKKSLHRHDRKRGC